MSWLDEALEYRDRGWAVIPLIEKRPAVKWRAYQKHYRPRKSWRDGQRRSPMPNLA